MRNPTPYAIALALTFAQAALAAPPPPHKFGDPVAVSDEITLDPIIDGRLRWENVDQPATDADAVTLRLRAGFEMKHKPSNLAFLAEAEGTVALGKRYNAFPYPVPSSQRRPQFSVVPDPENIELNRLQLQYKGKAVTLTAGRQRINLDDQRFVGAVGWRQNEQTFDAMRGEAKFGPVSLDATYAISQRTIFGMDGDGRTAFDGDFVFLGAGAKLGPVQLKGFAYLLDFDAKEQAGTLAVAMADTQTYGLRATTSLPLAKAIKLNLAASYARQSDWKQNPVNYGADYIAGEAGIAWKGLAVTGGYEKLGASNGRSFQTPMATLHKFNGWADRFLVTPAAGLQDIYGGMAYKFDGVKALPGLNAAVTYHQYDSDVGGIDYGNEWNASLGFKLARGVSLLAKYADYNAKGFGVDTRIFWLQGEFTF